MRCLRSRLCKRACAPLHSLLILNVWTNIRGEGGGLHVTLPRPSTWAALACSRFSIPTSAAVSPPRTCRSFTRSEFGESTATSHVDLLNSMAAYTDTPDLSFSFIGGLHAIDEADEPGGSSIASIMKSIPIPRSRWLPLGSSSGLNQTSRLVRSNGGTPDHQPVHS